MRHFSPENPSVSRQEFIALRLQIIDLQHRMLMLKFRADQARAPAGTSTGGQWISEGGGTSSGLATPAIDDTVTGSVGVADQPQANAIAVQGARLAIQAAVALFSSLAAREAADQIALLAVRVRDFVAGERNQAIVEPTFVGEVSREDARGVCTKLDLAQSLTDQAAASVRREDYASAAEYGTAVHKRIKELVDELGDPNFRAERSITKQKAEALYGEKGSIRVDLFEKAGPATACVYDIKTGRSGLTMLRTTEIVRTAFTVFPDTKRILAVEVRPSS